MWLKFNAITGAQVGDFLEEEPIPEIGFGVVKVPGSALTVPAVTVWDAETRGFIEPPAIDAVDAFALLTEAELTAILTSGVPAVIGLVLGMILTTLRGQKVRLDSAYHQQGALLLLTAGFLTQERYEQFRDGVRPTAA